MTSSLPWPPKLSSLQLPLLPYSSELQSSLSTPSSVRPAYQLRPSPYKLTHQLWLPVFDIFWQVKGSIPCPAMFSSKQVNNMQLDRARLQPDGSVCMHYQFISSLAELCCVPFACLVFEPLFHSCVSSFLLPSFPLSHPFATNFRSKD